MKGIETFFERNKVQSDTYFIIEGLVRCVSALDFFIGLAYASFFIPS